MKITGKLTKVFGVVPISDSFKRRCFVIEHNDRGHVEYISFELFKDHCNAVDRFKPGDNVTVHFNLKGRKWTNPEGEDKFFNTLQAWEIEQASTMIDN